MSSPKQQLVVRCAVIVNTLQALQAPVAVNKHRATRYTCHIEVTWSWLHDTLFHLRQWMTLKPVPEGHGAVGHDLEN